MVKRREIHSHGRRVYVMRMISGKTAKRLLTLSSAASQHSNRSQCIYSFESSRASLIQNSQKRKMFYSERLHHIIVLSQNTTCSLPRIANSETLAPNIQTQNAEDNTRVCSPLQSAHPTRSPRRRRERKNKFLMQYSEFEMDSKRLLLVKWFNEMGVRSNWDISLESDYITMISNSETEDIFDWNETLEKHFTRASDRTPIQSRTVFVRTNSEKLHFHRLSHRNRRNESQSECMGKGKGKKQNQTDRGEKKTISLSVNVKCVLLQHIRIWWILERIILSIIVRIDEKKTENFHLDRLNSGMNYVSCGIVGQRCNGKLEEEENEKKRKQTATNDQKKGSTIADCGCCWTMVYCAVMSQ